VAENNSTRTTCGWYHFSLSSNLLYLSVQNTQHGLNLRQEQRSITTPTYIMLPLFKTRGQCMSLRCALMFVYMYYVVQAYFIYVSSPKKICIAAYKEHPFEFWQWVYTMNIINYLSTSKYATIRNQVSFFHSSLSLWILSLSLYVRMHVEVPTHSARVATYTCGSANT
jgi:hypothetical protein